MAQESKEMARIGNTGRAPQAYVDDMQAGKAPSKGSKSNATFQQATDRCPLRRHRFCHRRWV